MTSPSPSLPTGGAQSGAGNKYLDEAGIIAPEAGANSRSKFGLNGSIAGAKVTVGVLFPVTTDSAGQATAEQVMEQFAKASPGVKAQIQHMLMLGGFYSASASSPNYGVLSKADLDAMAEAVTTAAQTGADLGDYLTRQAKFGQYTGAAAALGSSGQVIKQADPLALAAQIDAEYQRLTGKKATPSERAGFIAAYQAAYKQFQQNATAAAAAQGGTVDTSGYSTARPIELPTFDATMSPDRYDEMVAYADQRDAENLALQPTAPADGTDTTVDEFDPAAFAEQYVRQNAAASTGAHDLTSTFSNFLQILGGIR